MEALESMHGSYKQSLYNLLKKTACSVHVSYVWHINLITKRWQLLLLINLKST